MYTKEVYTSGTELQNFQGTKTSARSTTDTQSRRYTACACVYARLLVHVCVCMCVCASFVPPDRILATIDQLALETTWSGSVCRDSPAWANNFPSNSIGGMVHTSCLPNKSFGHI